LRESCLGPAHPRGCVPNTFLLERLDRRIREPKDLEAVYGLPLLGVVPESSALSRSGKGKKDAKDALPASEDAFPLLGKVDGVIIVGRVGRNRRDVAQRLHETLTGAGAPLLGVVANGFKSGRLGGYGYGYSYDYAAGGGKSGGSPKTEAPSADGAGVSEEPVPSSQS
jgi:hypothetical protein